MLRRRHNYLMGLLAAICALALGNSPAHAEFTSGAKSTEGTAHLFGWEFEDGTAAITCLQKETASSEVKWKIENALKVAAEKGPRLLAKIKKWGKCTATSSKIKEVETTMKECEVEVENTGEEATGTSSILTQCTATISGGSTCEVKLTTAGNSALKEVLIESEGEAEEPANLASVFKLTKVTAEVAGTGCSTDGFASTKEGKIAGQLEAVQVRPSELPTMIMTPNAAHVAVLAEITVTVRNSMFLQMIGAWRYDDSNPTAFLRNATEQLACELLNFTATATCSFKVKALRTGFAGIAVQSIARRGTPFTGWGGLGLQSP
jgi:hypothetical protein